MTEQLRSWATPTAKMVSSHNPGSCFVEPAPKAEITAEVLSSSSSHYSIALLRWRRQRRRQPTRHHNEHLHRHPASLGLSKTILFASIFALLGCSPCISEAAAVAFTLEEASTAAIGYSEIIFDQTPPPARMVKRANTESSLAATTASSSSSSSRASPVAASTTQETAEALPSPFDSGLGNNFTQQSCYAFFQSFLSDAVFQECIPLSLLLQTSTSFFTVEQSPVSLAQTLQATCSVDLPVCSALMASYARQIQLDGNCAADLKAQNPLAMQAYDGFASYDVMYHAGCLQDGSTGAYCFSDAVTNASSPTSSYIYYLPLAVALPPTANPACSSCLENTMALFAGAASNKSQPVSGVYNNAAKTIDKACGAGFVNDSVVGAAAAAATVTAEADSSSSSSSSSSSQSQSQSSSAHSLMASAAIACPTIFAAAALAVAVSVLL